MATFCLPLAVHTPALFKSLYTLALKLTFVNIQYKALCSFFFFEMCFRFETFQRGLFPDSSGVQPRPPGTSCMTCGMSVLDWEITCCYVRRSCTFRVQWSTVRPGRPKRDVRFRQGDPPPPHTGPPFLTPLQPAGLDRHGGHEHWGQRHAGRGGAS